MELSYLLRAQDTTFSFFSPTNVFSSLCIYLRARGDRDNKSSHLLVHSPKASHWIGLCQEEAEKWELWVVGT